MDKIKFRVWDKRRKTLGRVLKITWGSSGKILEILAEDFIMSNAYSVRPSDAVLEQYTGVLDNEGSEICEGDIVKWTRIKVCEPSASWNGKDIIRDCVITLDKMSGFRQEMRFDSGAALRTSLNFHDPRAKSCYAQIVGNIHDGKRRDKK